MKQKLLVEKKLEGLKISLIGLENMLSRQSTREEFLNNINVLKQRVEELQVLINRESEDFQ